MDLQFVHGNRYPCLHSSRAHRLGVGLSFYVYVAIHGPNGKNNVWSIHICMVALAPSTDNGRTNVDWIANPDANVAATLASSNGQIANVTAIACVASTAATHIEGIINMVQAQRVQTQTQSQQTGFGGGSVSEGGAGSTVDVRALGKLEAFRGDVATRPNITTISRAYAVANFPRMERYIERWEEAEQTLNYICGQE